MRSPVKPLTRLMLWMSGVDEHVLAECPTEQRKFVATGGVVLMAAGLAATSAAFTLHVFLRVPTPLAGAAALAWGAAIMNLDRWLLMSIRRQRTPVLTVAMALPRLLLAVVVGLVVAQPLVLWVFQPEVEAQARRDKGAQLAVDERNIEAQTADIERLRTERKALQSTLAGPETAGAVVGNARYRQLSHELAAEEARAHTAQGGITCEIAGTCGSDQRGEGPVTRRKVHVLEAIEGHVARLNHERGGLTRELSQHERESVRKQQAFAAPQLGRLEATLGHREAQRAAEKRKAVRSYNAHPGLLDRVEALSLLSAKRTSVRDISRLLWLLILAIDSLPAFVKTIQSLGRPSLYEQVLDEIEEDARIAVASQREANADAHKIAASTLVSAAEVRRDVELKARTELTEKTVAVQKEVAETFIDGWRETMLPLATEWAEQWAEEFRRNPKTGPTAADGRDHAAGQEWDGRTVSWDRFRRTRQRP